MRVELLGTFLCLNLFSVTVAAAQPRKPVSGYIASVPLESKEERVQRHQKVTERRKGTAIIVHRGASAFAPENTLEAYAAAMDYGADGCEIDIRRTADGVLVLFHDDMLDNLTDGFGAVEDVSYYELLCLTPRQRYGTATPATRPPTLAAVLVLARQRAMLLHLDIKNAGLDAEIARLLTETDMWDHIVSINAQTAPDLVRDSQYKPLNYKVPGLYEDRKDMDPDIIREGLQRPGELIMVDDPRVAASLLKRPAYRPIPLPTGLRAEWQPNLSVASNPDIFHPAVYLRQLSERLADNPAALKQLLREYDEERSQIEGDTDYQQKRIERILARAWAAQRLSQTQKKTPALVKLLEHQVRNRSLHSDWRYHGLDGAMAVRALGKLDATESVPMLTEIFLRVDPDLKRVTAPQFARYPLGWTDFRLKMSILPVLGQMRTPESKRFLLQYLEMDEKAAREIVPPQYEEAAKSLFRHPLTGEEIRSLLRSRHAAVRGTAILLCLDHPSRERTEALKEIYPWALNLPAAKRR
jgi:hypothetical protein